MHGFRDDTGGTVRFLTVCESAQTTAEMFRHYDRAGRSTLGGLKPEEIVAIAARYGVHMI